MFIFKNKNSSEDYIRKIVEKNRFYNSLEKINKAIAGSLDVREILQMIFDALDQNLKYKSSLLIVDKEAKKLKALNIEGKTFSLVKRFLGNQGEISVPLYSNAPEKEGLAIICAKDGEMHTSDSMYEVVKPLITKGMADSIQKVIGVKYGIVAPVKVKGEVIAVLTAGSKTEILKEHEEVLSSFADLAGVAISHAKLFEKVQQQVKEYDAQAKDIRALFNVGQTITETLDFDAIAQKVVDSIPKALEHLSYLGGIMTLMDWEKRLNKAFVITNSPLIKQAERLLKKPFHEIQTQIDISEGLASRAIREQKYFLTANFSELISQHALPTSIAKSIQKLVGMKSGAVVPIIVRDKIIGSMIFVMSKPMQEVEKRDEDIMWSFASQVGIGMENARLYETEKERAESFKEVNRELVRIDNIKSEFLSIASHQLRTPLSGIKGYLSMIKAGDFGPIEQQQNEVLDIVYENTNRLIQLVNDFLNVSRIEGGRLKIEITNVKLKDVIMHVVKELEPIAEARHLRLIVAPSSVWPLVKADTAKVTEVFTNIIDNAIKYTPQGSVEISTEIRRPHLIVKVKDTGVGIAKEEIGELFQKFTRGKNSNKVNTNGSGIGLYVVKSLLKVQNADVWVESPGEGQGSTFFVKIPLV